VSDHTILYDADCGFCQWTLAGVLAWDRRRRLRPLALQRPEADRLLAGMDHDTKMASWHLVAPDGRVHSAGAAVPALLRLLPGGAPLAALAARLPGVTDRAYRWVATHRTPLSRPVPRRWKTAAKRRIARYEP
jgi:predicted DCC family thiol-disulfide oxidoreductase YuxK